MKSPNQPVLVQMESLTTANLNKVHNIINTNVLEGTNWNTWGVLTKEGCAKGQLKLVIGSIADISSPSIYKDPYLSQSQFNKFKEDIESRLNAIEEVLSNRTCQ
ncbi:MAG: hypothetical protein ABIJ30_13180 [bacterium]